MMNTYRILLVEDNSRFRHAVKDLLRARFPEIRILEEGDGGEAFQAVETHLPDLVFMDLALPRVSGLTLVKTIKERYPDIAIAVLTNHDSPEYEAAAFENGADHFLSKQSMTPKLVRDLVVAHQDGRGGG
jgi:DNA-binding NarL/FixJ family response regulator